MTEKLQEQLDRLEILYAEQDYTIQTLNNMVARQEQEISRLGSHIERLEVELRSLKSNLPSDLDPGFEKPPHY
jgi:uncharacterized coiled-coil protein SlyX